MLIRVDFFEPSSRLYQRDGINLFVRLRVIKHLWWKCQKKYTCIFSHYHGSWFLIVTWKIAWKSWWDWLLNCLWSEKCFGVALSLVMTTFRNYQKRIILKREKFDFLLPKVRIWQPIVGPFCARPKRMYYKVVTQEIVQTTSSLLSQLLYVGTFTRRHIHHYLTFYLQKNGELLRNLLWQFT